MWISCAQANTFYVPSCTKSSAMFCEVQRNVTTYHPIICHEWRYIWIAKHRAMPVLARSYHYHCYCHALHLLKSHKRMRVICACNDVKWSWEHDVWSSARFHATMLMCLWHSQGIYPTVQHVHVYYSKCLCRYPSTKSLSTCQRKVVPLLTTHLRDYKRKSSSANGSLGSLPWLLLYCLIRAGNKPVLLPMF